MIGREILVDEEDAIGREIQAQVIDFTLEPDLSPRSSSSRDLPHSTFRLGLLLLEIAKEFNGTDGRKKHILTKKKVVLDQIQLVISSYRLALIVPGLDSPCVNCFHIRAQF